MNNETNNDLPNETFTWLKPGAWRKPCIVHVTMVANGRRPLFGTLGHDGSKAVVEKTAIGWAIIDQQPRMLQLCPEIKILADKVMPDHHHIVLQVRRSMKRSIKEVVRGYMQGCKAEARKLGFEGNLYDGPPHYRVLTHKGHSSDDKLRVCQRGACLASQAEPQSVLFASEQRVLWTVFHFLRQPFSVGLA